MTASPAPTLPTTTPAAGSRSWRQLRLARGWEPVQLIGRLRIAATRDGIALPQTWLLVRWLFLWENHREPLPGLYSRLLTAVYTAGTKPTHSGTTPHTTG